MPRLCTSEQTRSMLSPNMLVRESKWKYDLYAKFAGSDFTLTRFKVKRRARRECGAKIYEIDDRPGNLLAVLGVLALVYQGFSYTRRENVLDIGPIHATADSREHVPLPPISRGRSLGGGSCLARHGREAEERNNAAVVKGLVQAKTQFVHDCRIDRRP